jgi:hypothetical protein
MKTKYAIALSVGAAVLTCATAAFAGRELPPPVGGPAPLLGAGLSGLGVLAAAGGGYIAMRLRRRK